MPSLLELQQRFADSIHGEDRVSSELLGPQGLSGRAGLELYRGSIRTGQTQALAEIFPVLQAVVGARFFSAMAWRFLRHRPSPSGDLHRIGADLPGFLCGFAPARELVYLPDLARLEWSWHQVFHAADVDSLALPALLDIPAEQHGALGFKLHPAMALLHSPWPLWAIWAMHQEAGETPPVDLSAGEVHLLLWRRGDQVQLQSLSQAEFLFLRGLYRGESLERACTLALTSDAHADPGIYLAALFERGLATGLEQTATGAR